MIQIELWQLVTGIAATIGAFGAMTWAFGKVLANQFKRGLEQQFASQEKLHEEREKALEARFKRMEAEIDKRHPGYPMCDARMTGVEAQVKAMPGQEALSQIYDRINAVAEEVSEVQGEVKGISENVRLIMGKVVEKGLS